MVDKRFDVVIIGAGPAGLFAAYQLSRLVPAETLLIERGNTRRNKMSVPQSPVCVDGLGGAGYFSDKIYFEPAGGWLEEEDEPYALVYMAYVAEIFDRCIGISERNASRVNKALPLPSGLRFKEYRRLVKFDSSKYLKLVNGILRTVRDRGVTPMFRTNIESISKTGTGGRFAIHLEGSSRVISADNILLATGRGSSSWLKKQANSLGLVLRQSHPYFGVRVEAATASLSRLAQWGEDPKFYHDQGSGFFGKTKMHCFSRNGHVISCTCEDMTLIDGTVFQTQSANTSFNVITRAPNSMSSSEGRTIVKRIIKEGQGLPLVQRMEDFQKGNKTEHNALVSNSVKNTLKAVSPGNITSHIPSRIVADISLFLNFLSSEAPNLGSKDTLVYAPVFEWFSPKAKINPKDWTTSVEGFFVAGDVAGLSQGVVMAAASGIRCAISIAERLGR